MITLHSCSFFLKQKWEQSIRSCFGRLQSIARPGPGRLRIFSLPNSHRTSALWNLNQLSSLLATYHPILSLVCYSIYWFYFAFGAHYYYHSQKSWVKKPPQENTHPSPKFK